MIDSPHVTETQLQLTAFIRIKVSRAGIREVMGPGLRELKEEVEAQGIAIAGPWFTHHLRLHPATFDFELSVPVAKQVTPAGRVQPGEWPAMRMATAVYQGVMKVWARRGRNSMRGFGLSGWPRRTICGSDMLRDPRPVRIRPIGARNSAGGWSIR
jgi:hypothetical protein